MKKTFTLKKAVLLPSLCMLMLTAVQAGPNNITEYMRANLYSATSTGYILLDGNMTQYGDNFSNLVDNNDAWKLNNFGENFGISRSGITLVIERRKRFQFADTTPFRLWNVGQRNYMIELITQNCDHPNVIAYLEDSYLQTTTPVNCNGTTRVNFAVTADPGSSNQNRFRVIFKFTPFNHLPFTFAGIRATRSNGQSQLQWRVNNENLQVKYEIERSEDGKNFVAIDEIVPHNMGVAEAYEYKDVTAKGDVQYRIRTIDVENNVSYSEVSRLFDEKNSNAVSIYPNPVVNKKANFFINSPVTGDYMVMLIGNNGSVLHKSNIKIEEGQSNQTVTFPAFIKPGIYLLQLIRPDKSRITKMISIQ